MRLSGIKLAGFKSFVDPTSLPLPANLTGVVGPNGCGKSNIIDAVRWVLGEASIKQLRGQDSEDVIFNGSRTRKPIGRASVELTFDNSDGQVTGPFAAYNEIAVRRELTRDGSSQYFLNSRKCLKRDVTDLFLGTGLGGRNQYAIIEQGMVSRMIEARPEELRTWLEEAAGISKYKERRRETESRIRQTRENLSRLSDLQAEVAQRLEVLRRQAASAERFKELKARERQLRAEILALRERVLLEESAGGEAAIEQRAEALEAARRALTEADTQRQEIEAALREFQIALNDEQSRVYEAESRVARKDQSLQHARELKALKLRELEQLDRQLADFERRRNSESARLEQMQAELRLLNDQNERADESEADAQRRLERAEEDAADEQERWDDFQQRSEQPLFQTEGERVRVQSLERALFQADERHKRLSGEFAALDPLPLQETLFQAEQDLERLAEELSAAQQRLLGVDGELAALRDRRAMLDGLLHETRQQQQQARGRLASLETLQQAALRQDDAELGAWLRAQGLAEAPRLAQRLQVSAGWDTAVECVLEGLLQAPVTEALNERSGAWSAGPAAGLAVVDGQLAASAEAHGCLASCVQGPAAVQDWLASIHLAESQDEALERQPQLAAGESLITREGFWCGRGWLRFPRKAGEQGGVIARAQLLEQLRVQVGESAELIREREDELADLRERQNALEQERRTLAAQAEQARNRQAQRLAFKQSQSVRLEQMQQRQQALDSELGTLDTQRQQQRVELDTARSALVDLEALARQLREERAQLQQGLASRRDAVTRARALLTQVGQGRQQIQIQLAGRSSAVAALERSLRDLADSHALLDEQRDGRVAEAEALDAPLAEQAAAVDNERRELERCREALRQARERMGSGEARIAHAVAAVRSAEERRDHAQEALQQARLDFENLRARRESCKQQFIELCMESGLDTVAVREGLPPEATPEAWDEQLAQTLRRIERLGAINLAAIQELEEAQERERYLVEQHADLTGALDTLEAAMRKIDAETQERFKETFDRVDTIFRDRFPKLFGGGEAYLELTSDDLLEAGVRVMARPPGKRNSSIQLLSGGEKAMTAVALLLGLFQLNPAPFCLMDEVDAPLDDANVVRFCEIVREMSQNVQFIIITHNKITMELAAHLHGVTMAEPGVSRLVSVDVQQAVALTEGAAQGPESKE